MNTHATSVRGDDAATATSVRRGGRLRRVGLAGLAALLTGAGLVGVTPPAWAADSINTFDVMGRASADGTLSLSTTITFDDQAPAEFVQRLDTIEDASDYTYYRFNISNITAQAGDTDLRPTISYDGDFVVITVDTSAIGATPLTIGYDVAGAARSGGVATGDMAMTLVSWPVLQGLSMPVTTATGTIAVPGAIRGVDCKSGAATGPQPCQMWGGGTYDAPSPNFQDSSLDAGAVLIFGFTAPSSVLAVDEQLMARWTLDRAFSTDLASVLAALAVLLVGAVGLFALWHMRGRDMTTVKDPTLVASFEPTGKGTVKFQVHDEIRPGHVGTVVDEHVDPIDVTATLLDLAVRGHLCIVQLPAAHPYAPMDWTFQRLTSKDKMRPFEVTLLDAIAPEDGEPAVVSRIGGPVEGVIGDVQNQLYQDVVDRGWFTRRPDQTRHVFDLIGWLGVSLAIVALVLLAAMTHFGLLGLALVALGVGLLSLAKTMPRRTASGVDLLHGLHALSMSLQTQPTDQVPPNTAYSEISKILPYAVVLGGRSRWVQALADADEDPAVPAPDDLPWYHGPADWNISHLPVSLDAFVANMSGRLVGRD